MYARGISAPGDLGRLRELYGIKVSPDLISVVTDAVLEKIAAWQAWPLEPVYPLVFFGALRVKVRDEGIVPIRRSISRSVSVPTAPRKFLASGSNRTRAPSSGCAS